MILFFDTETTGLAKWSLADDDAAQPRLVQLACILTNDQGDELASFSSIIKPDGFEIPQVVADIHGIETEFASEHGIPVKLAVDLFHSFQQKASLHVAHNYKFDRVIMNNELSRCGVDYLDASKSYCTMLASTNVCGIKGTHAGKNKWPKLIEAYKFLFNESFEGQHDALMDVRACMRVFFELKERGLLKKETLVC